MSSKPFDATVKDLVELDAAAWAALVGASCHSAQVIDADVSTLTAASDKVIRVEGAAGPGLLNLEMETSHAGDVPERMHFTSTVLRRRHGLPVRSAVVLLRPEANASVLTGVFAQHWPSEAQPYDVFRYDVIRLW